MPTTPSQITLLLKDWRGGDKRALDRLVPLVYSELHRIASHYVRRERNQTLQTTALVHEVYLRLVGRSNTDWHDRAHFLAVSAQIIRSILVDQARARSTAKRGAGAITIALNEAVYRPDQPYKGRGSVSVLELEEALNNLSKLDPQQGHIVELRFYGGMTNEETAEVLGVSVATVKRDWNMAKAWLYREMAIEGT